ncbi:hypothetical protein B0H17DRAFT_922737 [Mycena rosella]|uniref:Pentatricopeptide repeat-containing protein-mitochondrial domain-containing protein n=1 Tax=Mycena rosella TaxID=1033263 RepID=A0AAD7GQH2_MYCRO|nr:hypothetical protein B0H17DRAFT_922737 [Mycena rosella]
MASKADLAQFHACFHVAAEMKTQRITPTLATYNTLLRALAHGGYNAPSLAVLEDMLSVGISPDVISFNFILHAYRTEPTFALPLILKRMHELRVAPNSATYTILIARFVDDGNLEVALQYLHEMRAHGLHPEGAAAQAVIVLAANRGHPRLAVDLAVAFEAETVRKIEDSVWLACLHSSAAQLYADGVVKCWSTLVTNLAISPDEGLCTLVLHTAARNGLPDLAADVLRILQILNIAWKEHHIAPLLEAFCRAQNFLGAFSTLNIMRKDNMDPTLQSALPVVQAVEANPDILDDLWGILAEMYKNNTPVDISAFNALLQASVSTQPLSRALGDFNSPNSYGLVPNAETFHIFLDGCISAGNVPYAEHAYQQFKDAGIHLDHDMIGKMITLHLTQDFYLNAFLILDEMKEAGHVPAQHLYEALAVKCAANADETGETVIADMKAAGYKVHPDFLRHVANLYQEAEQAEKLEAQRAAVEEASKTVTLDGLAQRFIETGGLVVEREEDERQK